MTYNILVLGAAYGSLVATKLLAAGHDATLVCRPEEAELISRDGTFVSIKLKGESEPIVLRSGALRGTLSAVTPEQADPAGFDLVVLAMQEPQYRAPEVKALLARIGNHGTPCISVMNMPPLPFLKRLLRRRLGLGSAGAGERDAVQPGPPGDPFAGRRAQRAAGHPTDQLQGGAVRERGAHGDAARAPGRYRGDAPRG